MTTMFLLQAMGVGLTACLKRALKKRAHPRLKPLNLERGSFRSAEALLPRMNAGAPTDSARPQLAFSAWRFGKVLRCGRLFANSLPGSLHVAHLGVGLADAHAERQAVVQFCVGKIEIAAFVEAHHYRFVHRVAAAMTEAN